MAQESSALEQALSRALRDNLGTLQRSAEELRLAVEDVASACSSSKPANTLPPMLRAQAAAASLAATLDVLTRFIATALQPQPRMVAEEAMMRAVSVAVPPPPMPTAPPLVPTPMAQAAPAAAPERVEAPPPLPEPVLVEKTSAAVVEEPPPLPEPVVEAPAEMPAPSAVAAEFDLKNLPHEQQELHRKASRHAKVSMQDIKLIRPEQVRLGRENRDLCSRLKDDVDKARKEYERRFKPILDHPVDYFYDWMVLILADGDPEKLGDYPYPSAVHRR